MARQYNASVTGKILVTPDLMILRVRTDTTRTEFQSGQYTVLGLFGSEPRSQNSVPEGNPTPDEKLIMRPYSIASSRGDTQHFEFFISQVKSGQLSPRLFALEMGARLHVGERIVGVFTLGDTPKDSDIVMVATGTGLAPYISFLRSHLLDRPNSKMAVIHGAANTWDLGYFSELTLLAQTFPSFHYIPTLTNADSSWNGSRLWIEEILKGNAFIEQTGIELDPDTTHVFLCGNPAMVENCENLLTSMGYKRHKRRDPGSLHVEEFK